MKDASSRYFLHPPHLLTLFFLGLEVMWSQAPDHKGKRLMVHPGLAHSAWDSDALSLLRKTTLSCLLPVSPFVLVNKMLSYLLSACPHLGALLLFILPVMLWPKILALVPSAQSGFHGYFLAHHSSLSVFTALITLWNYLVYFFTCLLRGSFPS